MAPPNDEQQRTSARIDELESRLALQDQQRQIAQLETQLRQLGDRVRTLNAPEAPQPADEIPPHY